MDMQDKVVVVTGASRNLGRAIALECAAAGADVVVNYAKNAQAAEEVVEEIRAMGRRAIAVLAQVESYQQVDAMMQRAIAEFGRIDVLVNNAGVLFRSLLMMMNPNEFETLIRINLVGTFNCIKAVSRHMIKARAGTIVNISSLAGTAGLVGQGAYSASKSGINSLTRIAAKELSRYGIRVNSVAPGAIDTGMMKDFDAATQTKYTDDIPMARYGDSAEVARVVLFMAGTHSSYMTGQVVGVDGGMSC